jgi:isopenicillin-N N-acyltransferase-like protein
LTTIPLLEINGSPTERGRAHGEAARAEIARSLDHYRRSFAVKPGLAWADVLARVGPWRKLVGTHAPHLLEEMDGIAAGAGVHPDEVLALNARGEIARNHASRFTEMETDGCSSFALLPEATGDGHVYCGQNWDWRAETEATTVLIRIVQPPKPTVIMQVEAGQVGRHGVNSAGIALNANGLDGAFGAPAGLPQPVLRRLILDSPTLRDALRVPYTLPQHIATNLLFTHRDGFAVDLETTPLDHRWGVRGGRRAGAREPLPVRHPARAGRDVPAGRGGLPVPRPDHRTRSRRHEGRCGFRECAQGRAVDHE